MENNERLTPETVDRYENARTNRLVRWTGVIVCLCAIAEFVVWITDTARERMTHEMLMGIGFMAVTVGALWYLLAKSSRRCALAGLWTGVIAGIALFFVGMCIS